MPDFNDFIDRKRKQHEGALARHAKLNSPVTWRMKLRFRVLSKLNTDAVEVKSWFQGRRIFIRSRTKGEPINQSEWIIVLARRFKNVEAAAQFGLSLQAAISAIAAVRSFPVDVGFDNAATAMFGDVVKDAFAKKEKWLIDDVHGVDVYPDTQTAMVTGSDITITTTHNPEFLTQPLEKAGKQLANLDDRAREASLLINAAFMAPHPVATLTLGVAAVELLAASERWNPAQKEWIKSLEGHLAKNDGLSEFERSELLQAINGLNSFGALSRTRRLLRELGLADLMGRWEKLYRKRSRLFHGDKLIPFPELQNMGSEARTLSQSVLKAYIERSLKNWTF